MLVSTIAARIREREIGKKKRERGPLPEKEGDTEERQNATERKRETGNERRNTRAWSQSPRADPAKLFKFKFEISSGVANILFVSFGPQR